MRLVTIEVQGHTLVGCLEQDIVRVWPGVADMTELIVRYGRVLPRPEGNTYSLEQVRLLAPIVNPRQDVICLGMNYYAHAQEAAQFNAAAFSTQHQYPVYFSKRAWRITGPGEEIDGHFPLVKDMDYETELAVVLAADAWQVPAERAADYVFGYSVFNDYSARSIQTAHKQFYFGKSPDGYSAMGPVLVTADEVAWPPALNLRCHVNGELRQDSNTNLMIFGIDHVIAELSRIMTLKAGTILSMGTPAGVGMGFDPPRFLQSGDVVRCEIEHIGVLENTIR